jgi:acetoin utilization deacetylase AcuC-like enzyme
MYLTPSSFECAGIAVGSVLELVQRITAGTLLNGIAVVRPPGHHVEIDAFAGGLGVFNNVAVAARAARASGLQRVLIVDWDVHHGNGTQHIFEEDPSVMYFSLHRYDNGTFFPCSKDAAPEVIGHGAGKGFNINVAWNIAWKDHEGMGDDEYLAAFQCVLLPIARDFNPQLILVSAGFDAAAGDVGGCCVTPAGFAQMTRSLQKICPKIVLALEGGYKLGPMGMCVSACVRALLDDDVALNGEVRPKREARLSIERTLRSHLPFWASLYAAEPINVMTATSIPIQCGGSSMFDGQAKDLPAADAPQDVMHATEVRDAKAQARRKKPKEKAVTGVSVSTRNAANANCKADLKKLIRKEVELESVLQKLDRLKMIPRSRASAKDRALLESEDDIRWKLEEIRAELDELKSLSKDDVLRLYSGCR